MGLLEAREKLKKNKKLSIDEDTIVGQDDHVEIVSTGSIILDKLLGKENKMGGIGRGRITELFGLESSSKCLTGDTYIKTDKGIETISEIFIRNDVVPSCTNKEIEKTLALYNEKGNLENTTHFTCNGRKTVHKIETRSGSPIKGTAKHPLRVIDENGFIVWKYLQDIKIGDFLVSRRFFTESTVLKEEDYKFQEARLLGYLIADGCFTDLRRIGFSNSEEDVVVNFKKSLGTVLGVSEEVVKDYPRKDSNSIEHYYCDHIKCREFYNNFDIKEGLAKNKIVPYKIRTEILDYKRVFIQSFMDLESHFNSEKYELVVNSASYELLLQIKLILQLDFGIISFFGEKEIKLETWEESRTYYDLSISGYDLDRYINRIGFAVLSKKSKVRISSGTNHDSIPNVERLLLSLYKSLNKSSRFICTKFFDYIGDKTKANLTKVKWLDIKDSIKEDGNRVIVDLIDSYFKENYYFDCVYVSEIFGEEPTFDFAMSKSSSFIANGICSHNTSISLHICKEIQKLGGNVIFADFEAALDRDYAKNAIGVDVSEERFMHLQPQCLEEGCDIIDALLDDYKESKIDCIVIDSVKAMTPKVVLEGQMGDEPPMMIQSRKIGTWLSKLVKRIKDTGTSVILLNQMIKNVKTTPFSSGGEYETPGGLSIRFYASTRIELKIVTRETTEMLNNITNAMEEMPDSVKIRANIVKNKIGTPYKKGEYFIKYGRGVDNKRSIIDIAVAHNIIARGGAWYTYKDGGVGGFKIQGDDAMREFLNKNENVSTLKEIIDQIIFQQDPQLKEDARKLEEEEKKVERKLLKKGKKKEDGDQEGKGE